MKIPLYIKFLMAYIIFGAAGFITIATLSSGLTYNYLIRAKSSTLKDEAGLIATTYSSVYSGQDIELEDAYPQIQMAASFLHSQIWVIGRDGTIIVDTENKFKKNVIKDFDPTLVDGSTFYTIGNYFNTFDYNVLSVSAPINGNYKIYGYVVIHMPISTVISDQNEILNIVYITSLIVFILSTLILIVFHKIVYAPLKKITEAAKQYASGNLNYKVQVDTNDEMGYLADTLNFMSDEMGKVEDYQRNFITNISHDFRSPLTSIKGYLEAILDGTISVNIQDKYIKRVIDEADRLTKLTGSILTLNDIDAKGMLIRSNFDINRVIKNTAASFEVQCDEKDIILELIFSDETAMVYADLGKIQQVLYNLIDNAVKFSHNNSKIYISTYPKKEKIFISVNDSGIGIDKKEVVKIFERFYKSDSSRGKDKKGTGLGLSIVKDIIQAHGENIDTISTKDVGTEFIFSLPAAAKPQE
ncbi:sensor histidine kinase [Johnsonella ignava]|uniref:sensor histidine kinase n=1 Tax=Johnsonella ignava TaxID=43995 RepID=UPI0023EFAE18|nr:HAMP domain-containing sensor histidine kinase [Johnsonella ignava]